jgi:predicted AlkP superfamily pyrophosphatase or phosphodiesterase
MRVLDGLRAGVAIQAAAGALFILAAARAVAQPSAAASKVPALIVFITVDQMRADYLDRFASQYTGAFARFNRGAAEFTNAYQDHAITETAPGHSVTMSGRFPGHTGIVTNAHGVPDPHEPLIGGGGAGASPFRFRGSTLIDWIRIKDPRSRALSVSRKDRGAILPMGRAHQNVFWYATDGRFTTSTYYADTLPSWVQQFNARKIPQSYAGKTWSLLLPSAAYSERDSVIQENGGKDLVFPHAFPSDPAGAARDFTNYPAMDSLTAQLALAGVSALNLGRGPQTDILAVSFSTTDAVGHAFGPDSREIHDQLVRLDRYMGALVDSLYKLRDSTTIVFALTADHGAQPNPELRAEREHVTAQRVNVGPLISAVRAALTAAGADTGALRLEEGIVTLDRHAIARTTIKADSVLEGLATSLRKIDGIARVDFVNTLARRDTTRDVVARRWLHMIPPDYPADFVISLAPYAYYVGGLGATHGTPNDLDAHVPVVFYGPWFTPGKYTQRALVADMAPTLAAVAGVKPTERLDGRARVEAIRPIKR